MKIDEDTNARPVNENAGTSKNESAKRDFEKRTREAEIRRAVVTTSIIGFVLLITALIVFYTLYKKDQRELLGQMEMQKNSLNTTITARDSVIGEWITTFDDIEKNIALIKEKEHVISLNSSDKELSRDKKQQVIEDIKYINTLLEQNKQKIASLSAQLSKSGGTIKALQNKIADLEASVKQSENEISELKTNLVSKEFEIGQLNTKNTDLQNTIVKKDEKIIEQTSAMNKAFFACGTYKQLKAKGLLTKEGGFIGLGKTKTLARNFSDSSFKQIDISVTKSIAVNSKNARLISEHPSNSYQFIRDKDKKVESLEIKDPVQFWKISKYAVIELN